METDKEAQHSESISQGHGIEDKAATPILHKRRKEPRKLLRSIGTKTALCVGAGKIPRHHGGTLASISFCVLKRGVRAGEILIGSWSSLLVHA